MTLGKRRTGVGTHKTCPRLSKADKKKLRSRISVESARDHRWSDPTSGSRQKRKDLLRKCGDECFGCPNAESPMYPICDASCSPRCTGISTAVGYATKYGATTVRSNLSGAHSRCKALRKKSAPKNRAKSKKSWRHTSSSRRRRRKTSPSKHRSKNK